MRPEQQQGTDAAPNRAYYEEQAKAQMVQRIEGITINRAQNGYIINLQPLYNPGRNPQNFFIARTLTEAFETVQRLFAD